MTLLTVKHARPIPSDSSGLSEGILEIIDRNLASPDSPPTRETVIKICVDDDLVADSQKEEILRYFIKMSSLKLDELRPLWRHLRQQYVVKTFNEVKTLRYRREQSDWKPRWAD